MKKTKSLLLLFVLTAANIIYVNAQKVEEGKVVYEISYPDADMPDEQLAQMPTEGTVYFKETKSRMEMKMGMGINTVTISDGKSKTATTLMDMMGNKMAIKMTEDDVKKQKEKSGKGDYDVKVTDETKEIAGYQCKKAVASNKEGSFDIYFTDEINAKSHWNNEFKGINGFLMEFKMNQGMAPMLMKVKSVSKEKVDDKMFDIPAEYKEMTQEEMKKMFGGEK